MQVSGYFTARGEIRRWLRPRSKVPHPWQHPIHQVFVFWYQNYCADNFKSDTLAWNSQYIFHCILFVVYSKYFWGLTNHVTFIYSSCNKRLKTYMYRLTGSCTVWQVLREFRAAVPVAPGSLWADWSGHAPSSLRHLPESHRGSQAQVCGDLWLGSWIWRNSLRQIIHILQLNCRHPFWNSTLNFI